MPTSSCSASATTATPSSTTPSPASPPHRRKLRRFPYLVDGQRVWVEARDVGDDNGTHFPRVGEEFAATGQVRTHTIGRAECRLMNSRALTRFATRRLGELLTP